MVISTDVISGAKNERFFFNTNVILLYGGFSIRTLTNELGKLPVSRAIYTISIAL